MTGAPAPVSPHTILEGVERAVGSS